MIKVLNNRQTGYQIRQEFWNGQEYLVVPVTMMVEGVRHNNRGRVLYTADALAASARAWNGHPVVVNHPQGEGGEYRSAHSEGVAVIGMVQNARMVGPKLRAEAWLHYAALRESNPEILEIIENGRPLEISIGHTATEDQTPGQWGDEDYDVITQNIEPDHLALLPDAVGACSIEAGCGVGNKLQTNKGGNMAKDTSGNKEFTLDRVANFTTNEGNYLDTGPKIQRLLDSMDSEQSMHWLDALYDNYFIYRQVSNINGRRQERFYKQEYSLNASDEIELQGDPIQVRKQVEYPTVTRNSAQAQPDVEETEIKYRRTKNKGVNMSKDAKCGKIAALIANEQTQWTDQDTEYLNGLDEGILDKLVPNEVKPKSESKKEESAPTTNKKEGEENESKQTVNVQELVQQEVQKMFGGNDPEKFLNNLPDGEFKEQLQSGMAMHRNKRERLVKEIAANSNYTEDELKNNKKWSIQDLEKLHGSVVPEPAVDYSAMGDYSINEDGVLANGVNKKDVVAAMNFHRQIGKEKQEQKK